MGEPSANDGFFGDLTGTIDRSVKSVLPDTIAGYKFEDIPAPVTCGAVAVATLGGVWGLSKLWSWCFGSKAKERRERREHEATVRSAAREAEAAKNGKSKPWYKNICLLVCIAAAVLGV